MKKGASSTELLFADGRQTGRGKAEEDKSSYKSDKYQWSGLPTDCKPAFRHGVKWAAVGTTTRKHVEF
jgi:hypothetical protein